MRLGGSGRTQINQMVSRQQVGSDGESRFSFTVRLQSALI
jgi:hypothetical protein